MPRGDKSSYTSKQKRQAKHIEEGLEKRGAPKKVAKSRAWATVNATTGGAKKSGAGRAKKIMKAPAKKAGVAIQRTRAPADRVRAAKKAAASRKQEAANGRKTPRVKKAA